ncbi:MAG: C1 family peptidase [Thermoplasmatota archaeon]
MKKRLITPILVFLLCLSPIISIASTNNNTATLFRQNESNRYDYDTFLKTYGKELYEKCPVMLEPITPIEITATLPSITAKTIPPSFSWLNNNGTDWSTPARHQGNCGSCWAFASVGSLESRIKIAEKLPHLTVDLSEQYVLSCLSDAGSCYGGSGLRALQYILNETEIGNNCNGIIPETCMPYQADHNINCSEKCLNWAEKLVPITNVFSFRPDGSDEDREKIKAFILEQGPIATHIAGTKQFSLWGLEHHDPTDYFPKPLFNSFTNHLVILYGWKDDPQIKNGGYWIVKNSWGDYWGYHGFFNIEYGALHIDDSMVAWASYDADNFDWEPVADAGKPKGGSIDESFCFDARQSFDDNKIISYHWEFGDGSTATEPIVNHSYQHLGTYNVTLTVTDDANQRASDTIHVWIQETNKKPATPDIQGKKQGKTGNRYQYNFSSTDPDENDIYYLIDWGDNTSQEWIGPYESGKDITLKKRWNIDGIYTIRVKTKDVFNEESEWATLHVSMPKDQPNHQSPLLRLFLQFTHFRNLLTPHADQDD